MNSEQLIKGKGTGTGNIGRRKALFGGRAVGMPSVVENVLL